MSQVERKQIHLPAIQPVDWHSVKTAMRERYNAEMRIETGVKLTRRALEGKRQIVDDITDGRPDGMDMLIMQSYVFGAAEIIQDYMGRP